MSAKNILLKWFESGDLQRVLTGLKAAAEYRQDKNVAESATFQSSRLQSLKESKNRNLISQADYQLESDRIRQAILEIIQSLPGEWDAGPLENLQGPLSRIVPARKFIWLVAISIITAILAGIWHFTNGVCKGGRAENAQPAQTVIKQPEPVETEKNRGDSLYKSAGEKTAIPHRGAAPISTSERQVSGYVTDSGNHALEGVEVSTPGAKTKTDSNGYFVLILDKIPPAREVRLYFLKPGFGPGDEVYFGIPNNNIRKTLNPEKK